MKKTLAIITTGVLCLTGVSQAVADTVELHGITFETLTPAYHQNTGGTPLAQRNILVNGSHWTNESSTADRTFGGLYFTENGGLKFNNGQDPTVTHLYLAPSVTIKQQGADSNNPNLNKLINWNGSASGHKLIMSGASGAWLDINRAYTAGIDVSGMNGGTVYLNTNGRLGGSTLAEGNKIEADAQLDLTDIAYVGSAADGALYTKEVIGDTLWVVTRTLMLGDYSAWTNSDNVTLNFTGITPAATQALTGNDPYVWNTTRIDVPADYSSVQLGNYWVQGTSTALTVSYVVPEPATATLSLLALAGLCARRRRK